MAKFLARFIKKEVAAVGNLFLFELLKYRLWWLTTALLFFWAIHPDYLTFLNFYDQRRVLHICWLFLTVLMLVFDRQLLGVITCIFNSTSLRIKFAFGAFVAAGLFSTLESEFGLMSWRDYLWFLANVCGCFSIMAIATIDSRGLRLFFYSFSISGALYLFKFFVSLVAAIAHFEPIRASVLISGVLAQNFAAQFLVFLIPSFSYYILENGYSKIIYFTAYICIFLLWLLVLIADYRGLFVATFIAIVFSCFFDKKMFIRLLLLHTSIFFLALFAYFCLVVCANVPAVDGQVSGILKTNYRLVMWRESLDLFLSSPLWGRGPYSFPYLSELKTYSHPHNFYMQMLAEWGGMAFLSLLYIAYHGALDWVRKLRASDREAKYFTSCLLLSLVAGAGLGGVSGVFVMPLPQMLIIFFVGSTLATIYGNPRVDSACEHSNSGFSQAIFAAVFALIVVSSVILIIMVWVSGYDCVLTPGPRFWSLGGESLCN